jgi:hypothetical protein
MALPGGVPVPRVLLPMKKITIQKYQVNLTSYRSLKVKKIHKTRVSCSGGL